MFLNIKIFTFLNTKINVLWGENRFWGSEPGGRGPVRGSGPVMGDVGWMVAVEMTEVGLLSQEESWR